MREVSASFLNYDPKESILKYNNSNADYVHFDVLDGKFVKYKHLTIKELENYLKITTKKKDVHLMVKDPSKYIEKLALYDIDYLTIHYEIKDFEKHINMIKDLGFKVGISIKPETDLKEIFPLLDKINLVLIMSIHPGKSGTKFLKSAANRIKVLKEEIKKRNLLTKIEVDGGINNETLEYVLDADILVSASFIINDLDNINILKGDKNDS